MKVLLGIPTGFEPVTKRMRAQIQFGYNSTLFWNTTLDIAVLGSFWVRAFSIRIKFPFSHLIWII